MGTNEGNDDRLAVIIPSVDRPEVLHETVAGLARQNRAAAEIVIAVPGDEHVLRDTRALPGVRVIRAAIGSSRQRNTAIAALSPGIGVVVFLDDDVELDPDYLDQIARAFATWPDLVLADGRVLADGALAGPVARDSARGILAEFEGSGVPALDANTPERIYGCNMSVRRTALARVRFDERLALYGYMEDRDFAFQCARLGAVARCTSAAIVHLAENSGGRASGRRFGFSQVMNPLYLWRKGHYRSRRDVARQVLQPLVTNAALALAPNQRIDRRARLAGNWRALATILRGRIAPEDVAGL